MGHHEDRALVDLQRLLNGLSRRDVKVIGGLAQDQKAGLEGHQTGQLESIALLAGQVRLPSGAIQVPCRLVGQDKVGGVGQRPGYRHPLLLSAR